MPVFEGSRPKAVEGGIFPPSRILSSLSRNEKTSRDNPERIYSDREELSFGVS